MIKRCLNLIYTRFYFDVNLLVIFLYRGGIDSIDSTDTIKIERIVYVTSVARGRRGEAPLSINIYEFNSVDKESWRAWCDKISITQRSIDRSYHYNSIE